MLDVVDLAMFSTLVVAGPTPDHINVLIPDTVGPTVDAEGPVDLQHVVGPAMNLSSSLPPAYLATSLCENSVVPTLGLSRRAYWDEVTPILSGVCPDHPGEHVSSHSPGSHRLSVLLAVSGAHMSDVVRV